MEPAYLPDFSQMPILRYWTSIFDSTLNSPASEWEEEDMRFPGSTATHVQLQGVHLCCGGCTDAVENAVATVPGASCQCDMEHGTVDLTASDRDSARRALDAIADAGLHGASDDPDLAMRTERDLPPGKVRSLTIHDIHNCCIPCQEAIQGAIARVEGVDGDTARPGRTTFQVNGHFSADELLRSLNAAGFHAQARA